MDVKLRGEEGEREENHSRQREWYAQMSWGGKEPKMLRKRQAQKTERDKMCDVAAGGGQFPQSLAQRLRMM